MKTVNTNTEEWGNIELPGLSDEELFKKNWNIVANNISTWQNKEVRKKRSLGIKKAHEKNGSLSHELKLQCYYETFGPERNNNLYEKLAKKYNIGINYLNHIGSNFYKLVSDEDHQKNLDDWNKKYGFGILQIASPGRQLLPIYDQHFSKNQIPPSAIFHIRYRMADCSPKEIRDYLLPWTNGKYVTESNGKIANGRYINYRKKQYPFLKDCDSEFFEFTNMDDCYEFIKKYYGKNLTRNYCHQIINSLIKEDGPMLGWMIKKITIEEYKKLTGKDIFNQ